MPPYQTVCWQVSPHPCFYSFLDFAPRSSNCPLAHQVLERPLSCKSPRPKPVQASDHLQLVFSQVEQLQLWHQLSCLTPWSPRIQHSASLSPALRRGRGVSFAPPWNLLLDLPPLPSGKAHFLLQTLSPPPPPGPQIDPWRKISSGFLSERHLQHWEQ